MIRDLFITCWPQQGSACAADIFFTPLLGFRMTLLDKDEAEFEQTVKTIAEKFTEYINSSSKGMQTAINLS